MFVTYAIGITLWLCVGYKVMRKIIDYAGYPMPGVLFCSGVILWPIFLFLCAMAFGLWEIRPRR